MKNIIIIASLLLGMPLMAQTKVVKKNAVKANNFGILTINMQRSI